MRPSRPPPSRDDSIPVPIDDADDATVAENIDFDTSPHQQMAQWQVGFAHGRDATLDALRLAFDKFDVSDDIEDVIAWVRVRTWPV